MCQGGQYLVNISMQRISCLSLYKLEYKLVCTIVKHPPGVLLEAQTLSATIWWQSGFSGINAVGHLVATAILHRPCRYIIWNVPDKSSRPLQITDGAGGGASGNRHPF